MDPIKPIQSGLFPGSTDTPHRGKHRHYPCRKCTPGKVSWDPTMKAWVCDNCGKVDVDRTRKDPRNGEGNE